MTISLSVLAILVSPGIGFPKAMFLEVKFLEAMFWEERLMEARILEKRFLVLVRGGTVLVNLMVGTAKTKQHVQKKKKGKTIITINLCSGRQPPSDASHCSKKETTVKQGGFDKGTNGN